MIDRIHRTLAHGLMEEMGVLVLVVLVFLLSPRAATVPLLALPVVVLFTLGAMRLLGVPATLMSLGGIAIALGMAVDAELVALEACHRRLESCPGGAGDGRRAAPASRRPVTSLRPSSPSLVITALSFLPVLGFGGETGRLLRPLAATQDAGHRRRGAGRAHRRAGTPRSAAAWAVVPEFANPLTAGLVRLYRPFVQFALARPALTLAIAGVALLSCLPLLRGSGGSSCPGSTRAICSSCPPRCPALPTGAPAGSSDARTGRSPTSRRWPRCSGRWDARRPPPIRRRSPWPRRPCGSARAPSGRASRGRAGTPSGRRRRSGACSGRVWPEERPPTTAELVERLDRAARLPGWRSAWTAPVRARLDMMSTGIRTPVGMRIVAGSPARLEALGALGADVLSRVPGDRSAVLESLGGEVWPSFVLDAEALAR